MSLNGKVNSLDGKILKQVFCFSGDDVPLKYNIKSHLTIPIKLLSSEHY